MVLRRVPSRNCWRGLVDSADFQMGEEAGRVVVEDEGVGEVGGLEEGGEALVVGDLEGDGGVAAEQYRHFVLLAQAQQLGVARFGEQALVRAGDSEWLLISSMVRVSLEALTSASKSRRAVPSAGWLIICMRGCCITFITPAVFSSLVPPRQHTS